MANYWKSFLSILRNLKFSAILSHKHERPRKIDSIDDDEIFRQATKAYYEWCQRNGYIYDPPSRTHSEIAGRIIILRNRNIELGRYLLSPDGKLLMKILGSYGGESGKK